MSRYLIVAQQTAQSRDLLNEARTLAGNNDNPTPKPEGSISEMNAVGKLGSEDSHWQPLRRWLRSNE